MCESEAWTRPRTSLQAPRALRPHRVEVERRAGLGGEVAPRAGEVDERDAHLRDDRTPVAAGVEGHVGAGVTAAGGAIAPVQAPAVARAPGGERPVELHREVDGVLVGAVGGAGVPVAPRADRALDRAVADDPHVGAAAAAEVGAGIDDHVGLPGGREAVARPAGARRGGQLRAHARGPQRHGVGPRGRLLVGVGERLGLRPRAGRRHRADGGQGDHVAHRRAARPREVRGGKAPRPRLGVPIAAPAGTPGVGAVLHHPERRRGPRERPAALGADHRVDQPGDVGTRRRGRRDGEQAGEEQQEHGAGHGSCRSYSPGHLGPRGWSVTGQGARRPRPLA